MAIAISARRCQETHAMRTSERCELRPGKADQWVHAGAVQTVGSVLATVARSCPGSWRWYPYRSGGAGDADVLRRVLCIGCADCHAAAEQDIAHRYRLLPFHGDAVTARVDLVGSPIVRGHPR